jgi:acylpyruvate hydrolase
MQDARTDRLIFDVPTLIGMISVARSLGRGDVIITGTHGGVGAARKPPVCKWHGDVLSNVVQDE